MYSSWDCTLDICNTIILMRKLAYHFLGSVRILGGYNPGSPVNDAQMVQAMLAVRLFLPRVGIQSRISADNDGLSAFQ